MRRRGCGGVRLAAGLALLLAAALATGVLVGVPRLSGLPAQARLREALTVLATRAIGRPARVEGTVSLSLLPLPTLTATAIVVPDAGDGVTLAARSLRLGAALGPLLTGRVVPRDVVLEGAELHLPWPLPPGLLQRLPGAGLRVRIEDGRLALGGLAAGAIDATLAVDEAGAIAAAGVGRVGGLDWHATARLGAPDASGGAALALSLDGQGGVQDTGARFNGAVAADGTVEGQVAGSGADLSRLGPAPALPWRAQGSLLLAGGRASAGNLALVLDGAPAQAAAALLLGPVPRLDLSVDAGRLDLDGWARALRGAGVLLPVTLDLQAGAATLAGGVLRQLRASVLLDAAGATLRQVSAILPGEASLRLAGRFDHAVRARATDAPGLDWRFDGTAGLAGPDLRPARDWVLPFLPALGRLLPGPALRDVSLRGRVSAGPGALALAGLDGTLAGARIGGTVALHMPAAPALPGPAPPGPAAPAPPAIDADLRASGLALDAFLPDALPATAAQAGAALQAAGRALDGGGSLRLEAPTATWHGVALQDVSLAATLQALPELPGRSPRAVPAGPRLTVQRLFARLGGASLAGSGTLDADGSLGDARLSLAATDGATLLPLLPAPLAGVLGPVWHGPLVLEAGAAGPPDALALRLHLELADATLEAAPLLDLAQGRAAGGVTLRHPNARRLLGALLGADRPDWLGEGSLAVLAQASLAPGRLAMEDLDLTAGEVRATGRLQLDAMPADPTPRAASAVSASRGAPAAAPAGAAALRSLTGRLAFDTLVLPAPDPRDDTPVPLRAAPLDGWRAALRLDAGRLAVGDVVLRQAGGDASLEGGTLRLRHVTATLGGGALSGEAALVPGGARPPALSVQAGLRGLVLAGPGQAEAAPGPEVLAPTADATAPLPGRAFPGDPRGLLDADASVAASGYSQAAMLATLSGSVSATLSAGSVAGFDLSALGAALGAARTASPAPEADPDRRPDSNPSAGAPAPGPSAGTSDPGIARAAVLAALGSGRTAFDRLGVAATLADGTALLTAGQLQGSAGRATMEGSVDLAGGRLDLHLALQPGGSAAPALGLWLRGPLDAARPTPDAAALAGWLQALAVRPPAAAP